MLIIILVVLIMLCFFGGYRLGPGLGYYGGGGLGLILFILLILMVLGLIGLTDHAWTPAQIDSRRYLLHARLAIRS
jgi:hypothetical protein